MVYRISKGLFQLYMQPDRFARSFGAFGCLFGLIIFAFYTVRDFLMAILVFFDRIFVGIANGCCCRDIDYTIDPSWKTDVYDHNIVKDEVESFIRMGIPKARHTELLNALDMVVSARVIFQAAHPDRDRKRRHFLVASLPTLVEKFMEDKSLKKLKLTTEQARLVVRRLKSMATAPPPRTIYDDIIPTTRDTSEEAINKAQVSFSLFLFALQGVLAPRCQEQSRRFRTSNVMLQSSRNLEGYSVYLT
jgi:hypothetical protein